VKVARASSWMFCETIWIFNFFIEVCYSWVQTIFLKILSIILTPVQGTRTKIKILGLQKVLEQNYCKDSHTHHTCWEAAPIILAIIFKKKPSQIWDDFYLSCVRMGTVRVKVWTFQKRFHNSKDKFAMWVLKGNDTVWHLLVSSPTSFMLWKDLSKI